MPGFGQPKALSPATLDSTHPALVGAGERPAAGLSPRHDWLASAAPAGNALAGGAVTGQPPPAMAQNMLTAGMGGQPAPGAMVNLLTNQTVQPGPPPPPAAMPSPPMPTVLPGQEVSTVIGKATGADKMTDADLSKGFDRTEYIRNALSGMTRQATPPTHDDVLNAVAKGVKDGVFPAAEAGQIMGGITPDPAKLGAELDHRHVFAVHQLVHFAGEMQKRAAAKSEGAA